MKEIRTQEIDPEVWEELIFDLHISEPYGFWSDWTRVETADVWLTPLVIPKIAHFTGKLLMWEHKEISDIPIQYLDHCYKVITHKIRTDAEWRNEFFIGGHLEDLAKKMNLTPLELKTKMLKD